MSSLEGDVLSESLLDFLSSAHYAVNMEWGSRKCSDRVLFATPTFHNYHSCLEVGGLQLLRIRPSGTEHTVTLAHNESV
jgi:hypothetical protein